jgi:hypothetical protein
MEPGTPASLKKQKHTLDARQEESSRSLGFDITQPSFGEQVPVEMAAVPPTSLKEYAQPVEVVLTKICEPPELLLSLLPLSNQLIILERSGRKKGRAKW